jgi:hypothetical protein
MAGVSFFGFRVMCHVETTRASLNPRKKDRHILQLDFGRGRYLGHVGMEMGTSWGLDGGIDRCGAVVFRGLGFPGFLREIRVNAGIELL